MGTWARILSKMSTRTSSSVPAGTTTSLSLPAETGPWKSSVSMATTLKSTVGEECGPVNLFGGFGADVFRIGGSGAARTNIQDYESGQDSILLLQESGSVTTSVTNAVTTVLVDSVPVVYLDGAWADSDLEVHFNLFL